jgi:hypothetical protein
MGFQKLRILPYMAPSGMHWRCSLIPADLINDWNGQWSQIPSDLEYASYSSGSGNEYFGWKDAKSDNAHELASKFVLRFPELSRAAFGRDWNYSGWYTELMGIVERGCIPYAFSDGEDECDGLYLFGNDERFPAPPSKSALKPRDKRLPSTDDLDMVCDPHWCAHIPNLHKFLSGEVESFSLPPLFGDDLFDTCAYWEPLLYLLYFLFGWRDPGKGLLWWYRQERDCLNDKRLTLISETWGRQGKLDLFAAWAWEQPNQSTLNSYITKRDVNENEHYPWDLSVKEMEGLYKYDPYYGGGNPLHLGHSCQALQPIRQEASLQYDKNTRKAILILESIKGWYAELDKLDDELPSLIKRSWYVDVFVKPVGWLGTFRKSRETGLWFNGKHSLHIVGN